MKTQKTAKNAGGRPRGSRLDRPEYQRLLALAIARAGRPEQCWRGICSERSFLEWKKANRRVWEELKAAALAEFALQASLSNPRLLEMAVKQLADRLERGEMSEKGLIEVVKYFDGRRNEMK